MALEPAAAAAVDEEPGCSRESGAMVTRLTICTYSPEHVNYAMYFAYDGYFIHDAPWWERFGPGTNYPHTDPDGQHVTGSHGCVELPTSAMSWLYYWAGDGATIEIYGTAPVPPPSPTPTPKPATPTPTTPPAPTATPTSPPTPSPTA